MSFTKKFSSFTFLTAVAMVVVFCVFPLFAYAGGISFINRSIWYHPDPFFAGQTVRVYAGILNTNSKDAYGSVELFAGGESIGVVEFTVRGGGNVVTVWRDWRAVAGEVVFGARAIRVVFTSPGEPDEEAVLPEESARSSIIVFVDTDTDDDGIGDRDDPDDDNDGISDEDEKRLGTDPLNPNSDGDGVPDGKSNLPILQWISGGSAAAALSTVRDTVAELEEKTGELFEKLAEALRGHKGKVDLRHDVSTTDAGGREIPEQLLDIRFDVDTGEPRESAWRLVLRNAYVFMLTVVIWMLEHRVSRLVLLVCVVLYMLVRLFVRVRRRG